MMSPFKATRSIRGFCRVNRSCVPASRFWPKSSLRTAATPIYRVGSPLWHATTGRSGPTALPPPGLPASGAVLLLGSQGLRDFGWSGNEGHALLTRAFECSPDVNLLRRPLVLDCDQTAGGRAVPPWPEALTEREGVT